jgi:hypothetical protein
MKQGTSGGERAQVEAMAGFGISEAEIARVLQITPDKMHSLYAKELKSAATRVNARVAENLFRKAIGDGKESVTAAIFWLKTRAGWKESQRHELSGPEKRPIEIVQPIDTRRLAHALLNVISDSQLEAAAEAEEQD